MSVCYIHFLLTRPISMYVPMQCSSQVHATLLWALCDRFAFYIFTDGVRATICHKVRVMSQTWGCMCRSYASCPYCFRKCNIFSRYLNVSQSLLLVLMTPVLFVIVPFVCCVLGTGTTDIQIPWKSITYLESVGTTCIWTTQTSTHNPTFETLHELYDR